MKPYYVEYCFYRLLAFFLNLLSVHQVSRLADFAGTILFRVNKKKRSMALSNLRAAFGGEKSESEIQKIAKGSIQNLIKVAFEFIRIPRLMQHKDIQWDVQGLEHCAQALEGKKGFVVTLSHFGNWELMGLAAAAEGLPLHAIARPVKNPYVYSYIKHLRRLAGYQSIDREGAARSTIRLLKQNQMIAILIDRNERQSAVWVDFFGRKASTTALPAMLALKYKIPIIPTFFYRQAPDRFLHTFEKPFPLIETGDYEADLVANTQAYVSRIEEEIRKRPEDWLWMDRRWRDMPSS